MWSLRAGGNSAQTALYGGKGSLPLMVSKGLVVGMRPPRMRKRPLCSDGNLMPSVR